MGHRMKVETKYITLDVNQTSVKMRSPEMSLLFEVSDLLSTPLSMQESLGASLSKVLTFFKMDSGRIYLLDEDKSGLSLLAYHGIDPKGLEKVSLHTGFSGKAARTRSFIAQHVSDLEDRERIHLLQQLGLEVVMCVPLIKGEKVLGVMNLAAKRDIAIDHGKIDLLTIIGNQMAVAIDNSRLYRELEDRLATLNEQQKMITFFAYSVSHDLKSPAAGLYALANRLKEKHSSGLDGKGMEHCDLILKTARQMLELVEMINLYIASKEAPMHVEEVSVGELVQTIVGEFSHQLDDRHVQVEGIEGLPKIAADRIGLTRIFRNLIDNALKYGGDSLTKICFDYQRKEGCHLFSFSNDGVGVPEKDKDRLFEPFKRSGNAKGVSGTGMGLAIVKEMVKRHGGRIWLDPDHSRDVRFHLSISDELKPEPQETSASETA